MIMLISFLFGVGMSVSKVDISEKEKVRESLNTLFEFLRSNNSKGAVFELLEDGNRIKLELKISGDVLGTMGNSSIH